VAAVLIGGLSWRVARRARAGCWRRRRRWRRGRIAYIGNASRYLYYQLTGTYMPASQIYVGP
jgi:hypothetical protein